MSGTSAQRTSIAGRSRMDRRRLYAAPARLALNQWALVVDWTMGRQAAVVTSPTAASLYRFHARDVHLVMGPPRQGASIRFRVAIDGPAARLCTRRGRGRWRPRRACRTAVVPVDSTADANVDPSSRSSSWMSERRRSLYVRLSTATSIKWMSSPTRSIAMTREHEQALNEMSRSRRVA